MTIGDFVEFEEWLDPSVAASIGGAGQRQAEARLPRQERKKKVKEKAKSKKRLAHRVNWDLPVSLKQRIKKIAEEHLVPESQVAGLLLLQGLQGLDSGAFDLDDYKARSNSPRYEWTLDLETLENALKAG